MAWKSELFRMMGAAVDLFCIHSVQSPDGQRDILYFGCHDGAYQQQCIMKLFAPAFAALGFQQKDFAFKRVKFSPHQDPGMRFTYQFSCIQMRHVFGFFGTRRRHTVSEM